MGGGYYVKVGDGGGDVLYDLLGYVIMYVFGIMYNLLKCMFLYGMVVYVCNGGNLNFLLFVMLCDVMLGMSLMMGEL